MGDKVEVSGEESYVAKLTVKTLGCNAIMVKTLPPEQTKLALCRIFGKAADTKEMQTKDPSGVPTIHTFFTGVFEGINLQDGTVLRSGKLFLPKGISEVVESAIKNAQAKDDKASVSFAFEIRSVKATNPIGYSYEAVALKDPAAEDELAEMRNAIAKLPTHEQKLALKQGGKDNPKQIEGQTRKSA